MKIGRHFSAFGGQLNKYFCLKKGYLFIDLTLGDGGHTEEALKMGCKVISFDVDPESIKRAVDFIGNSFKSLIIGPNDKLPASLSNYNWIIFQENFTKFTEKLHSIGLNEVENIIIDLGPSQNQVLKDDRGFSFNSNKPLDMRIDPSLSVTAKDLVNVLNEGELKKLFLMVDESYGPKIARIITTIRKKQPIITCKQLSDVICRAKHTYKAEGQSHPATKVFMALRMAVNSERDNIQKVIGQLPTILSKGGIAGIITFHSGEDGLVKREFADLIAQKKVIAINKKPIETSLDEQKVSKRTRSAKLRLIKKC